MKLEEELRRDLAFTRSRTDELFETIDPAALYDRPIPERHRIVFYLGHLEAFDWNQIGRYYLDKPSFHPEFDRLFEAGIDPEPGKAPGDTPADWPSIGEVRQYNAHVRESVDRLWENATPDVLQMAIEHREMHAETFTYMLHHLDYKKKMGHRDAPVVSPGEATAAMIEIPSGIATLGKRRGNGFGWDNEFQETGVHVPRFRIGKYKITNGEYLEFVKAGAAAPHFWIDRDGAWFYRGMLEEISLPLNWPVYVTQREAAAYANWKNRSLPSEAQFHRAATGVVTGSNYDYARWDPIPVNASPDGDSVFGVSQLVGNGWEWTSTVFAPFAGFESQPSYPGYSANFFDGEHYVVKGASPRTAARLTRPSFRNWFRPEYPYIYTAFRLVEN